MIINNNVQGIAGAYLRNVSPVKTVVRNDKGYQQPKDEIQLSSTARTFQGPLRKLRSKAGEVRQDRVAFFEAQLANGSYRIDPEGIAEKIMQTRF